MFKNVKEMKTVLTIGAARMAGAALKMCVLVENKLVTSAVIILNANQIFALKTM